MSENRFLTAIELSEYVGCARNTIYKKKNEGRFVQDKGTNRFDIQNPVNLRTLSEMMVEKGSTEMNSLDDDKPPINLDAAAASLYEEKTQEQIYLYREQTKKHQIANVKRSWEAPEGTCRTNGQR